MQQIVQLLKVIDLEENRNKNLREEYGYGSIYCTISGGGRDWTTGTE